MLETSTTDFHFINVLGRYCTYDEGVGNGIDKIKVRGEFNAQTCANKCFQMRRDKNKHINGATLDQKTCRCEVSQTHTWYSRQKKNCQFRIDRKPIGISILSIICLISNNYFLIVNF